MRFKRTCQDFGVRESNIRIVATEATRNAINREDLLRQIDQKTGWRVELLAKEDEGRLGAMGIASSLANVDGLCMDMGGGSVQLTWVIKKPDGEVDMSPVGSVSFPYGAAALMSELSKVSIQEQSDLPGEVASKLQSALVDLQIPESMKEAANRSGGYNLYLSGGGFRGWGYILMSHVEEIQPYPIPLINGYNVDGPSFLFGLEGFPVTSSTFRVSSRRASQVPAVQLLIKAMSQAQIPISQVHFSQGGVREGLLYTGLPRSVRMQNPLIASTLPYAPESAVSLNSLLRDAVPESSPLQPVILTSTINLLYVHGSLPKDIRAAAALRSTITGVLAGAHGLSHRDRGLLALVLRERWGGDLSDSDIQLYENLQQQCGKRLSWWAKYVGCMASAIGNLFPAGIVRQEEPTVTVKSRLYASTTEIPRDSSPQLDCCWVNITVHRGDDIGGVVRDWAEDLKKIGKKKNWGKLGWGLHVDVEVRN